MEYLLSRLDLHEDEEKNFVWEEEFKDEVVHAKWLAIGRYILSRVLATLPCTQL